MTTGNCLSHIGLDSSELSPRMSRYAEKDIIITSECDEQDYIFSCLYYLLIFKVDFYLSPSLSQLKVIVWLSLCRSSASLSPVPCAELDRLVTWAL